jgi:hypothetical protein
MMWDSHTWASRYCEWDCDGVVMELWFYHFLKRITTPQIIIKDKKEKEKEKEKRSRISN